MCFVLKISVLRYHNKRLDDRLNLTLRLLLYIEIPVNKVNQESGSTVPVNNYLNPTGLSQVCIDCSWYCLDWLLCHYLTSLSLSTFQHSLLQLHRCQYYIRQQSMLVQSNSFSEAFFLNVVGIFKQWDFKTFRKNGGFSFNGSWRIGTKWIFILSPFFNHLYLFTRSTYFNSKFNAKMKFSRS